MEQERPTLEKKFTMLEYLKGKVAEYTISDNVINSVCFEREVTPWELPEDYSLRVRELCYADLLKVVYLQTSTTKSYAIANATWSQKEGATVMTEKDKERILREMRRIYIKWGEPESIPAAPLSRITMRAHGMRMYR